MGGVKPVEPGYRERGKEKELVVPSIFWVELRVLRAERSGAGAWKRGLGKATWRE